MTKYHYEWWTVQVQETTGLTTWELKGRDQEHVVKQIKKQAKEQNDNPYCGNVIEVYWNTLKLDRVGYQRLS
jgi:hypothetical protein